ncbi:MAG: Wzz/FepE/Etk N-terminal domain-containing protein [Arcicella sp.]|nr:Wzz/FepE/Etk N-terminal domain-containing protein [Arcicella sp.]
METNQIQHTDDEITIDISKIFKVITKNKWTVLVSTIIATVLGVFIAINTPNEYSSQVQILPELDSKDAAGGLSKFKSLAGLAGVDLSSMSSSEAVRPDLYPNILQSTPFLMDVMNMKVYAHKYKKQMVMANFLEENKKRELITKILGESNDDDDDMPKINALMLKLFLPRQFD